MECERPSSFPASIIPCGVRDVRDYRIHSERDHEIITGDSAFNLKAKSLRLGNFSRDETRSLCLQHTEETGQVFEDVAFEDIWHLTCGQPWLVNALAIESFRQFFRENSEIWIERFHYKEAGPQILLQAFLQRIINGGGRIDRVYGLGRTWTGLFILWRLKDGSFQIVKGKKYASLMPVVALTITDFIMFKDFDDVRSEYRMKEVKHLREYNGDLRLVFYELPKYTKTIGELETLEDRWLYFVKEAGSLEIKPTTLASIPEIEHALDIANEAELY